MKNKGNLISVLGCMALAAFVSTEARATDVSCSYAYGQVLDHYGSNMQSSYSTSGDLGNSGALFETYE